MAEAVEKAAAGLQPVRVGASVDQFDKTHRHSFGPRDRRRRHAGRLPALRHRPRPDGRALRRRLDPAQPKPLAILVNYPLHPEFLEGNDLISADYVAPLERMVDRETGAMTIFTQSAVGTAEPERSHLPPDPRAARVHPPRVRARPRRARG